MPDAEELVFEDLIRGEVKFDTSMVDDKVLLKNDGMPTYHLAVVVDDFLMKITHAFRGEEWLPSAPVHILVWKNLFGLDQMPKWAHLPLILKPDGNGKLSKRDGDRLGFPVFAMDWTDPNTNETTIGFKERGFLPEAFVNLLAMLGWNDGTDQEIFSLPTLIEKFSLERVHKGGAKFDYEKAKELHKEISSKAQISKDGLTDLYARQLSKDENGNDIYLGKNADGSENPKFKGSYVSRSYNRGLATGLPEGDPHIIPEGSSLNSLTSGDDTPEMFLLRKDNVPYIRFNNQSKTMFKGTSTTKPNIVVAKHFGEALWNIFEKSSASPIMSGQDVIITSSLRSLQDQEDIKDTNDNASGAINNSNHFLGEAIDISLKSNSGLSFGDWCQSEEGLTTLKANKTRVVVHGNPEHIHVEYNSSNPGWKCEKSIMDKYASRNWKSEL